MSTDIERIKNFKRLYIAVNRLMISFEETAKSGQFDEQCIEQSIININKMIEMFPFEFPIVSERYPKDRLVIINLKDAEDEPEEKMVEENGEKQFVFPENTHVLFESTILTSLEDWKFKVWNSVVYNFSDTAIRKKYVPLMLAQAEKCLASFPKPVYWQEWQKDMITLYTNQIGWAAFEYEEDRNKLEEALSKVERGFEFSNWDNRKYIKATKAEFLIKLGRNEEAYLIMFEAFKRNPVDPGFLALKTDGKYLDWVKAKEKKEKEAKQEEKKIYKSFLGFVAEEQAKVTDRFENPEHPLVVQYTDVLNLIKQRMVSVKLHLMYKKSGWKTADEEKYKDAFVLNKYSVKELEQYEEKNGLRLPDELKAYLLEIGEGGKEYFCYSGVNLPDKKQLSNVKKLFPITPDKIHNIKHYWRIKAWIDPYDGEGWKEEGVFKKKDDLNAMFGLPEKAKRTDGCMYLGPSNEQDELYLIMNGAFEGEVWVDTVAYGPEADGCFGAASAQRLTLLQFIAESLLAKQVGYTEASDKGSWK